MVLTGIETNLDNNHGTTLTKFQVHKKNFKRKILYLMHTSYVDAECRIKYHSPNQDEKSISYRGSKLKAWTKTHLVISIFAIADFPLIMQ